MVNYYVESGDFRTCVLEEDPHKAALHAITDLSDELEDSQTIPKLETLIRVSPDDWQSNIESYDKDVEFLETRDILAELEYFEILGSLDRLELDREDEYLEWKNNLNQNQR